MCFKYLGVDIGLLKNQFRARCLRKNLCIVTIAIVILSVEIGSKNVNRAACITPLDLMK